jgi:hypothetical protein
MLRPEGAKCNEDRPCPTHAPCSRCEARLYLTADDWRLVQFYLLVADQVVAGMGDSMPRLEGYEAALRLYGYGEDEWPWLVAGAQMLHRLLAGQDDVQWHAECGKPYREIGPEDVDGD